MICTVVHDGKGEGGSLGGARSPGGWHKTGQEFGWQTTVSSQGEQKEFCLCRKDVGEEKKRKRSSFTSMCGTAAHYQHEQYYYTVGTTLSCKHYIET